MNKTYVQINQYSLKQIILTLKLNIWFNEFRIQADFFFYSPSINAPLLMSWRIYFRMTLACQSTSGGRDNNCNWLLCCSAETTALLVWIF